MCALLSEWFSSSPPTNGSSLVRITTMRPSNFYLTLCQITSQKAIKLYRYYIVFGHLASVLRYLVGSGQTRVCYRTESSRLAISFMDPSTSGWLSASTSQCLLHGGWCSVVILNVCFGTFLLLCRVSDALAQHLCQTNGRLSRFAPPLRITTLLFLIYAHYTRRQQ